MVEGKIWQTELKVGCLVVAEGSFLGEHHFVGECLVGEILGVGILGVGLVVGEIHGVDLVVDFCLAKVEKGIPVNKIILIL